MSDTNRSEKIFYLGVIAAIVLGFYLVSLHSYLLFHSLIEITTIAIAFTLFILTWNTRRFLSGGCLKAIGIGYGLIAGVDLLHALAYKGMGVFPAYGANLPTQLWIAARSLQAALLCVAPLLARRRSNEWVLLGICLAVVSATTALVYSGAFPDCFIEGKGLTPFKIISEYVISALLLVALFLFIGRRTAFSTGIFRLIVISILCTIGSELAFTSYVSVYGPANMVGHFFKLVSFYLIYRALVVTGLKEPSELIFRDLEKLIAERTAEVRASEEQFRRLNRELRAISSCNQALMKAEDEPTLLADICRIICDEAGYRLAWVGSAEQDEEKTIRPVAWAGFDSDYVAHARLSWSEDFERGRGPAGIAIRSGEPVHVQDFAIDPRMAPWREAALARGYRSGLALPLKDENGTVFGVLLIYSAEPYAVTAEEFTLLEELAGDLAFGVMVLRARIELKRAEQELRQNEARLNEAQRIAHLGNWELDLTSNTLLWSEEIFRIFELDQEQFGASYDAFLKAIHPDDREMVDRAFSQSVANHTPYNIVHRLLMKDDRVKYVEERGENFYAEDGSPLRSVGTVHDITERKLAEENLLRLNERFVLAASAAGLGVWDWDIRENKLVWDDGMYALYGIKREDFAGAYEAWLQGVHPADRAASDEMSRLARLGEREYDTEFRVVWADGSIHYLKAYGQVVRDANSEPLRMTGVNFDITARKAADAALHRLNEELEQRVRERTAELEAKNEELERMNQLFVGRELRMVELKERIRELERNTAGNRPHVPINAPS